MDRLTIDLMRVDPFGLARAALARKSLALVRALENGATNAAADAERIDPTGAPRARIRREGAELAAAIAADPRGAGGRA